MKFNLFPKIFSAFMVTILAAIVVLALAMYFSANWRFSEYVTKVEMGQLEDLVAALGSVHQEKQSWEQFRENPSFWPDSFGYIYLKFPAILRPLLHLARDHLMGTGREAFRPEIHRSVPKSVRTTVTSTNSVEEEHFGQDHPARRPAHPPGGNQLGLVLLSSTRTNNSLSGLRGFLSEVMCFARSLSVKQLQAGSD